MYTRVYKKDSGVKRKQYGYELVLDLYDCNLKAISSKKKLQTYVNRLCRLIKMKKYGKTWIPYFGEKEPYTKGYTLVQLIETSSIVGHFSELFNSAYINIFSCKAFSAKKATNFTKKFFGPKRIKSRYYIRK